LLASFSGQRALVMTNHHGKKREKETARSNVRFSKANFMQEEGEKKKKKGYERCEPAFPDEAAFWQEKINFLGGGGGGQNGGL